MEDGPIYLSVAISQKQTPQLTEDLALHFITKIIITKHIFWNTT